MSIAPVRAQVMASFTVHLAKNITVCILPAKGTTLNGGVVGKGQGFVQLGLSIVKREPAPSERCSSRVIAFVDTEYGSNTVRCLKMNAWTRKL